MLLQVKIEQLVTAMGGVLLTKASLDVNFVIAKNVLAAKYKVSIGLSLFLSISSIFYAYFLAYILFLFSSYSKLEMAFDYALTHT